MDPDRISRISRVRVRLIATCAALAAVVCVSGCEDDGRVTGPDTESATPLLVSDPATIAAAPLAGAASLAAAASRAPSEGAYVSLPPESIPNGRVVVIRNTRTGSSVTAPMVSGGFDPVLVAADAGDILVVEVEVSRSATPLLFQHRVPAARRPVVVRTTPPRGKRDVALNARIVVVFSEPIDDRTLTGTSVQLLRGTTAVAGRLEGQGVEHLTVAFVPDAPLAAATAYQLVLTQEIRDLDGEPLEAPVVVEFTTGTSLDQRAITRLEVSPSAAALAVGASLQLTARVYADDREVTGRPLIWSSAHPDVATVDAAGRVTALRSGAVAISAATGPGYPSAENVAVREVSVTVLPTVPLTFASLSAGYDATCGVTTTGGGYCWGSNSAGQLGVGYYGATAWRNSSGTYEWSAPLRAVAPVAVAGGLAFTSIHSGWSYACGTTITGQTYCWGEADVYQLGQGSATGLDSCVYDLWRSDGGNLYSTGPCALGPLAVSGGHTFRTLSVGAGHACALTATSAAYCWGLDYWGQVGAGSGWDFRSPTPVVGGHAFTSVSAGGTRSCGLTTAGKAYCWGNPDAPGDGSDYSTSDAPVAVAGNLTFASLSVGWNHTCGLTVAGEAFCWGSNNFGQLGDGSKARRLTPVRVSGGLTFTTLSTSADHTCGVAVGGNAYCWGRNTFGELGAGDAATSDNLTPTRVAGSLTFAAITAGKYHTCGITTNQVAYCWGGNWGALGDGSLTSRPVPVKVLGQP